MPFRLADVKKTVRSRSDGERYLHPKLLESATVAAQVGLALSYFHSRLGRTRREVDPDMLVRFFGDPKVARGLVACLHTSYHWRTRELAEALDAAGVARLAAKQIYTPSDLRLYLYDLVNAQANGFLASEREEHLLPLAHRLRLAPAKLDQLLSLDADENAVLVRIGSAPAPEHVVALYNYYVVDALLRNSIYVELHSAGAPARAELESACAVYGVDLDWSGEIAVLRNHADAFGSYTRAGARLARALYSAAAVAPTLLRQGRARVKLPGKAAWYLFDKETERALTGNTGAIRRGATWPELREEWSRRRAAAGTSGWRLLSAPEPALTAAGLALAPFSCRRDETQVYLWPARDALSLRDALAMQEAGLAVLPVIAAEAFGALPSGMPWASTEDGAAGIVAALEAHWPGGRGDVGAQALGALLDDVAARGFLPTAQVGEALGCASPEELRRRLRSLDAARGVYLPGVGLCSPAFAEEMRRGLRRARRRKPAA